MWDVLAMEGNITIEIYFTHGDKNLNLYLLNGNNTVIASSTTKENVEIINYNVTQKGKYRIKIAIEN